LIGANFAHDWRTEHPQDAVIVLDVLAYAGSRMGRARVEKTSGPVSALGNIGDRPLAEAVLPERTIDAVVHCVAQPHADCSMFGPDQFIRTNIVGTHSLLTACRQVWVE